MNVVQILARAEHALLLAEGDLMDVRVNATDTEARLLMLEAMQAARDARARIADFLSDARERV